MIYTVVGIVDILLNIVTYIIIAQVILSWLIAFNIVNLSAGPVRTIVSAIDRMTAPLYRPIRRMLPDFGGIDFSPLVILLVIAIIRSKVLPGILLEVGPTIT